MLHGSVELAGHAAINGSAVMPGTPISTGREGTAALYLPGGTYELGASTKATLQRDLELASGLVEVSGPLAVQSGGWRIEPNAKTNLMVDAAPAAVYVSVRAGAARLASPEGHETTLLAGKAAKLVRGDQGTPAAIASGHRARNIIIGLAIAGGIAAAAIIYHEAHKTVQSTGPCDRCVASPAQ